MKSRHKWNGPTKGIPKRTANNGGLTVCCVRCGCVREFVNGVPTYLIGDDVHIRISPPCKNNHYGLKENN